MAYIPSCNAKAEEYCNPSQYISYLRFQIVSQLSNQRGMYSFVEQMATVRSLLKSGSICPQGNGSED